MIIEKARPKVNLTLDITGRRDDGYHLLHSLVVFPAGGDRLIISEGDDLSLHIEGPFGDGLPIDQDNLIIQVADFLRRTYQVSLGAELLLEKNLPVASGVGGGSADAAATLRGLNRFWELGLSSLELERIGARFGADIPVCIQSRARIMSGVGEVLSDPLNLPDFALLIVNPGISAPTPPIFKALNFPMDVARSVPNPPSTFAALEDVLAYAGAQSNDLQAPAVSLTPVISDILVAIGEQKGCLFHRMSGSGATCFGIFAKMADAEAAGAVLSTIHPNWWIAAAQVPGD